MLPLSPRGCLWGQNSALFGCWKPRSTFRRAEQSTGKAGFSSASAFLRHTEQLGKHRHSSSGKYSLIAFPSHYFLLTRVPWHSITDHFKNIWQNLSLCLHAFVPVCLMNNERSTSSKNTPRRELIPDTRTWPPSTPKHQLRTSSSSWAAPDEKIMGTEPRHSLVSHTYTLGIEETSLTHRGNHQDEPAVLIRANASIHTLGQKHLKQKQKEKETQTPWDKTQPRDVTFPQWVRLSNSPKIVPRK